MKPPREMKPGPLTDAAAIAVFGFLRAMEVVAAVEKGIRAGIPVARSEWRYWHAENNDLQPRVAVSTKLGRRILGQHR